MMSLVSAWHDFQQKCASGDGLFLASWGCFTDRNILDSLRKLEAYSLL